MGGVTICAPTPVVGAVVLHPEAVGTTHRTSTQTLRSSLINVLLQGDIKYCTHTIAVHGNVLYIYVCLICKSHMDVSDACLISTSHMHVSYACLICMFHMHVSYVCLICMSHMHVSYACLICMSHMHVFGFTKFTAYGEVRIGFLFRHCWKFFSFLDFLLRIKQELGCLGRVGYNYMEVGQAWLDI